MSRPAGRPVGLPKSKSFSAGLNVPMLEKMFKRRLNGYRLIGYAVE